MSESGRGTPRQSVKRRRWNVKRVSLTTWGQGARPMALGGVQKQNLGRVLWAKWELKWCTLASTSNYIRYAQNWPQKSQIDIFSIALFLHLTNSRPGSIIQTASGRRGEWVILRIPGALELYLWEMGDLEIRTVRSKPPKIALLNFERCE